ncbi:hypothetical protein KXD93_22200 [Mucilaginibacter sp. BJC16-A38]|uniref:hypothetical protein n=1 Tax=Mucilaginibacter phenanthrenivorans TaxID=1234842 RepID=UPI00215785BC|nr:hypothetical protein [Mucilaginibacter phenanthrenivorans]MCR8560382.1 hypothetical protein [Mucilaginibacter phenanthrenivorans]
MENMTAPVQQALFKLEAIRQSTDDKQVKKAILDCQELLTLSQEPDKLWRSSKRQKILLGIAVGLLFVCIVLVCQGLDLTVNKSAAVQTKDMLKIPKSTDHYWISDLIIYGLWIIGPPCFFLYEYTFIFGKDDKNRLNSAQRDDIKYCQDLGAKIWAAVAVLLSILLTIKYGSPFK